MTELRAALITTASLAAPVIVIAPMMALDGPYETGDGPSLDMERHHERQMFSQLAIAGMRTYRASCMECHGERAVGTGRGPSLLDPIYHRRALPKREFHAAVSSGTPQQNWRMGDMPGFSKLSFNQIEQIERYVRELQRPIDFR
ncbi:MAG: cytochrome c [Pseudomonadota bacterium]